MLPCPRSNTFMPAARSLARIGVLLLTFAALVPAHAARTYVPSGNLVANGSFEMIGVEDAPDAWVLKSWQAPGLASGKVDVGGRFGRRLLRLKSKTMGALYGCYTQPIEVNQYAGQTVLLSLHYRTDPAQYGDVILLTFTEDFTEREWDTPVLSREALPLQSCRNWTLVSRHIQLPATTRHAVVLIRIAGQDNLYVDGVSMRSVPAEIGCKIESAGLVLNPGRRRTKLAVTNNTTGQITGKVRAEIWDGEHHRGTVQKPVRLAVAETQHVEMDYGYDFRKAHELRITIFGTQEHEVYDDTRIAVPGLIDARIVVPAFRFSILNDIPMEGITVSGHIHAVTELVRATQLSARIVGGGQEIGEGQRITTDQEGHFSARLLPASIVSGQYLVSLRADVKNWTLDLELPFSKAAPSANQVGYDERGRLWANGKAIFPIGMGYLLESDDLPAMAEAGFNFVIAPAKAASGAFMDQAAAADLGVFVSSAGLEPGFWSNMAQKHSPRAKFWGWYILEKPETHTPAIQPHLLEELYADLRKLNPNRPVLCSLSSQSGFKDYGASNDIVIAWTEPRPPGELSQMAKRIQQAQSIIAPQKLIWALVPIAGGGHIRDKRLDAAGAGRAPTAAEYRAMAYLAIVCGAKGIVAYAYRIPGTAQRRDYLITRDAPQLWQQVAAVNSELSAIGLSILSGQRQAHPFDYDAPVLWGVWEHEGQAIVVIVNTTGQQQIASLTVDNLTRPVLQSITRPQRLEGTAQGLFGKPLAPYEAGVYVGRLN